MIEVEAQQAHLRAGSGSRRKGLFQAVGEQRPVRETGQWIVRREVGGTLQRLPHESQRHDAQYEE